MRRNDWKSKYIAHIVDQDVRQYEKTNALGKLKLTNFSEVHGCTLCPKISMFPT